MANSVTTGLRPAGVAGNHIVVLRFPVSAAGNPTYNLFIGDIVANEGTYGGVAAAAANAGVTAAGVIVALYDSNGVPIGSPGSSVSTKYLPLATAGYADVALALPDAIFVAPFGATYTPAATDLWGSVDHVATAGSTTTARSGHVLGGAGGINTEAQFQILGLVDEPSNAWGNYARVYVRFLESAFGQVNPTVGV